MTASRCIGKMLIAGAAAGRVMRIDTPISFWGGVDPETGRIIDTASPRRGEAIGGRILLIRETRGSSSSSAVMLELLARGIGPAAVVLGRGDAIIGLGILVAGEMGHGTIPLLELPAAAMAELSDGAAARIEPDGCVIVSDG